MQDAFTTGCVAWLARHLDQFDPFLNGRKYHVRYGQRVSELATALLTYSLRYPQPDPQFVANATAVLTAIQADVRFRDRVMRAPAEFALYADVHGVLRRMGFEDPQHEQVIQRAIDIGFLDHVERVPHREMDVRLSLSYSSLDHRMPDLAEIAGRSILAAPVRAPYLDDASIYALTHVIMFASAFGTRPVSEIELPATKGLAPLLKCLVASAAHDHHWDLLAELLLCYDCLELPITKTIELGWRTLLSVQRPDGAVPGPEAALRGSGAVSIEAEDSFEGYMAHHYHTTLVALMARSVHLARRDDGRRTSGDPSSPPPTAVPDYALRESIKRASEWAFAKGNGMRSDRTTRARIAALSLLDDTSRDILGGAVAGDGAQLQATLDQLDLSNAAALDQVAAALEGYGTHSLLTLEQARDSADVLGALGVAAARRYDLPRAARALRLAAAAGPTFEVTELTCFLLEQQTHDGSFGFFGLEAEAMRTRLGADFCVESDLRLPVAVACGRAMAAALMVRGHECQSPATSVGMAAPLGRRVAYHL